MPKEKFTKKTDDLSLLSSILENNNNEKPFKDTSPDLLDESSDYESYQKIKNSKLAERSLKFIHDIVRVSSSSPENSKENIHKDITLLPETTTKDTLFVNESKAPNPTKERPVAKKPIENKDGLSVEDIKIKNAIYKDIEYWKEKLTREYKDEKMNKINKINLLELQSNPYKWLQKKLENQQNKAKEELKDSDNIDDEQKEKLQFQLLKTENSIKNLKEAGVRNIPLKIGSDFTPLSIKLDRGLQFNITKHTEEINKAMGIISSGYSIEDVIQRANKRLLVVKTADGKIVEIPMQKVYELSKSEAKNPEAIIKKIRKGDIFEITQNGKDTLYNIVDKTNDTITYTINNIRGTSTTEQLAKLLSQEGISAKNLTLEKTTVTSKKPVEIKNGDIGEVEKNVTVKTEPKVISDESTNKTAQENKQPKEDLEIKLQNEELEKLLNEISEGDVIKTISKEGKDDPFIINNIKEGNITFTQIATGKSDVLPVNQFNDVFLNHFGAKEIIKAKKEEAPALKPTLEIKPEEVTPEIEISTKEILTENTTEVESNHEQEINSLKDQIAKRNERALQIEKLIATMEDDLKKESLEEKDGEQTATPVVENNIETTPKTEIEDLTQKLGGLKNQLDEVWEEYEKTSAWKFWKVNSLNKKIDTLDKKYSLLEKELQMEKVRSDMKERPFLYYAAHEITSPEIIKVLKNKTTETYDFSNIKTTSKDGIAYGAFTSLQKIGEEGFFIFNNLGFLLIIKNIEKLKTEKGINAYSEEGIYKIVGPDGTIISDDLSGYTEAFAQFEKVSEIYTEKLKEEFNKEK